MKNEKDVKQAVKKLLTAHSWNHWPNVANGYGMSGLPDMMAIKDGVFVAIETKFNRGKPTELQKKFLRMVAKSHCIAFVVSETTVDALETWLDFFEQATVAQASGQGVPRRVMESLTAATSILTEPFMEEQKSD
jgi:hypothetical protein